uniref:Vacuolar iron transporter n=1 Tax=Kalanchoe fedtschenkoi TaxID=63787 RepID=A0A7N0T7V2_KALFE
MAASYQQATCGGHKLTVPDQDFKKEHGDDIDQLERAQWLRAAILGANDGLLSTASLMLGVAAAKESKSAMMLGGLSGALAGACSMAVGEFVSVSTQRDIELKAMKSISRQKFTNGTNGISSLVPSPTPSHIMSPSPARNVHPVLSPVMQVIEDDHYSMKSKDNDEFIRTLPSPVKAAVASAMSFLFGSCVPLFSTMLVSNDSLRAVVVAVVTSLALAIFGAVGARLGGSPMRVSALRVLIGGWVAMGVTYGLLKPFDNIDDNAKGSNKD